jgi:hypothetical protein
MRLHRPGLRVSWLMGAVGLVAALLRAVREMTARPAAMVVGSPILEFRGMSEHATYRHRWAVRNVGRAPLRLTPGFFCAHCIIVNLGQGEIQTVEPGGQAEIIVTWGTLRRRDDYSQYAELLTDDPERPKIEFRIKGVVLPAGADSETSMR